MVLETKRDHTATTFLHMVQSPQACLKGFSRNQDFHTPSISRHSYNGPANNKEVSSKDLTVLVIPSGQYPMPCHGETRSATDVVRRRIKVVSEHSAVETETERILARIASGASLDRPGAARVDADAWRGST